MAVCLDQIDNRQDLVHSARCVVATREWYISNAHLLTSENKSTSTENLSDSKTIDKVENQGHNSSMPFNTLSLKRIKLKKPMGRKKFFSKKIHSISFNSQEVSKPVLENL